MIVRTRDGVYEVREDAKLFRRVTSSGRSDDAAWDRYDRLGPVHPGEPVRFFVKQSERGRVLHYRIVTTSPVLEVERAA